MKFWRTPLDQREIKITAGRVVIIPDRCKGCEFCVQYCPRGVLHMSAGYNIKGYHYPEAAPDVICYNCHFCEALCPDFAIYSVEDHDDR